jgi:UDP-N-acetylglucosamine 2-epimerase (non-hydrolysing)
VVTDPPGPGQIPAGSRPTLAVVLGTRPGIVKLAPVLWRLIDVGIPHFVIHSGQHYSENMDRVFFEDLDLPTPEHRIGERRPGIRQGEQTAEMLTGIEQILVRERPRVVLVGGDANTNLAGSLAARKLGLIIGHVEAGLRSRDWRMPEEHNRVMIDHISDVLFASSEHARATAQTEGIRGRVVVTGSTIGEALRHCLASAGGAGDSAAIRHGPGHVLVTLHRQENVDNPAVLRELCTALCALPDKLGLPLRWLLHPRTRARLTEFGLLDVLTATDGLVLAEPAGYAEFTQLLSGSALMITDSGGVQQEACILRVPCVTARPSTEWVETVEVGANWVAGTEARQVIEASVAMAGRERDWPDPFQLTGTPASHRIVQETAELLGGGG